METSRTDSLKVENLSRDFGKLRVLADITFSVHQGEIICILGPSGCGKTTLLRIIAGLIPCEQGSVRVGDEEARDSRNYRRHIGLVFQEPRLLPWRTAAGNVALPFELAGLIAEQGPVESALQLVGLLEFGESYPHQLSGGMRQRVALARALATDPNILLLDEPLTGLDVRTREELQDEIIRIQAKTGKSLIWVTHDPQEAIYLADRIIVLSGRPTRVKAIIQVSEARPRQRSGEASLQLEKEIRALFE